MTTDNDYSASELYNWAVEAGQQFPAAGGDDLAGFHRDLTDTGDEIWDYLDRDYIDGRPMNPHLLLSILELHHFATRRLNPDDPRLALLHVWDALAAAYAFTHNRHSELSARGRLILRTQALLAGPCPPPEPEIYSRIIDLELIDFDWDRLDQLEPGIAALIQSQHKDWQQDLIAALEPNENQPALFDLDTDANRGETGTAWS